MSGFGLPGNRGPVPQINRAPDTGGSNGASGTNGATPDRHPRATSLLNTVRSFANTQEIAGARRERLKQALKADLTAISQSAPDIVKPEEIDQILQTPDLFTSASVGLRDHLITYGATVVGATGGVLFGLGLSNGDPKLIAAGVAGMGIGLVGSRAAQIEIAKGKDAGVSELALIFALRSIGDKAEGAAELRAARRGERETTTNAKTIIRFQAMVGALKTLEARLDALQVVAVMAITMAAQRGPMGVGGAKPEQIATAIADFRGQIADAKAQIEEALAVGPDGTVNLGNGFLGLLAPQQPASPNGKPSIN